LLLHTARQEPLGRVLLEAAASGLPVVATDVGGTPEIFPADAHGAMLVRPGDVPAVVEAVAHLLSDEQLRQAVGRAARARAEAVFDVQAAAGRVITEYYAVL
jgi:glycosyltransferase involved in cell wall biosynthesis